MRRLARRAGLWAGGLLALFLLTAFGLALVPAPKLNFPLSPGGATALPCAESAEVRCVAARDGVRLALRRNPAPPWARGAQGGPVVLLLHGVLASGAEPAIAEAARRLEGAAGVSVYRLDLRDHGLSASRGRQDHLADLDHIGQFEEDVADVLAHLRREHPEAPLVLAGHSMGGGIALRYLARPELRAGADVDGVLLYAPLLGERSPTARKAAKAEPGAPPLVRAAVPRIVGLALLNLLQIRVLNGLGTLYFDLPADLPVRGYSFRAMASLAPEDYRAALRSGDRPLLAIVGSNDEAFQAEAYPRVIALHPKGETVLVPGASHDGVLTDPRSTDAAATWLRTLAAARRGGGGNPRP